MLPIIGRIFPSDPPEKWKAIQAALENDDKTRRMLELIRTNSRLVITCLTLVLLTAIVMYLLTLFVR